MDAVTARLVADYLTGLYKAAQKGYRPSLSLGDPLTAIGGGLAAGLAGGLGHYATGEGGARNLLHSLAGGAALGTLAGGSAYAAPKLLGATRANLAPTSAEEMRRAGVSPRVGLIESLKNVGADVGDAAGRAVDRTSSAVRSALGVALPGAGIGGTYGFLRERGIAARSGDLGKAVIDADITKRIADALKANPATSPVDILKAQGEAAQAARVLRDIKRTSKQPWGAAGRGAALGAGAMIGRTALDEYGGVLGTLGRMGVDAWTGQHLLRQIPKVVPSLEGGARRLNLWARRVARKIPHLPKGRRGRAAIPALALAALSAGAGQGYNWFKG